MNLIAGDTFGKTLFPLVNAADDTYGDDGQITASDALVVLSLAVEINVPTNAPPC